MWSKQNIDDFDFDMKSSGRSRANAIYKPSGLSGKIQSLFSVGLYSHRETKIEKQYWEIHSKSTDIYLKSDGQSNHNKNWQNMNSSNQFHLIDYCYPKSNAVRLAVGRTRAIQRMRVFAHFYWILRFHSFTKQVTLTQNRNTWKNTRWPHTSGDMNTHTHPNAHDSKSYQLRYKLINDNNNKKV